MNTKNKKTANTEKPVWFITGCSTGFGRELATQALERGFRTVVTARKPDEVEALAARGEAFSPPSKKAKKKRCAECSRSMCSA